MQRHTVIGLVVVVVGLAWSAVAAGVQSEPLFYVGGGITGVGVGKLLVGPWC